MALLAAARAATLPNPPLQKPTRWPRDCPQGSGRRVLRLALRCLPTRLTLAEAAAYVEEMLSSMATLTVLAVQGG